MKHTILVIDRVEHGLVDACKKLEKHFGVNLRGVRLVGSSYRTMHDSTYVADSSGFFEEIEVDYDDKQALENVIGRFYDDLLAVTCRDESSIESFMKVIPLLPEWLPVPSLESLRNSTQKQLMRKKFAEYDPSLTPRFVEIRAEDVDHAKELTHGFEFPVIVKPSGLNTSMLVRKCIDRNDLEQTLSAIYEVLEETYRKRGGNGEPTIVVEEFIEGKMYSIDAYIEPSGKVICAPAVSVTTSHEVGKPGFYAYESTIPSGLSPAEVNAAEIACKNAIKSLDLTACTAHIELFKTSNGWKIVEVGPRIGGHRQRLYELSYGIDHYYNDLASRIEGVEPEVPITHIRYAVSMNIYAENEGRVKKIVGVEEVQRLSTNVYVRELIEPGDMALSSENGSPYHVDAVFADTDKDKVFADAKTAHVKIKIEVEEQR